MINSPISSSTWFSIDDCCPLRCQVDGSDLATVIIGDDHQGVELTFNAAGLLRLAETSQEAVAELASRAQRDATEQPPTAGPTS